MRVVSFTLRSLYRLRTCWTEGWVLARCKERISSYARKRTRVVQIVTIVTELYRLYIYVHSHINSFSYGSVAFVSNWHIFGWLLFSYVPYVKKVNVGLCCLCVCEFPHKSLPAACVSVCASLTLLLGECSVKYIPHFIARQRLLFYFF
jgi:hypothetical protein